MTIAARISSAWLGAFCSHGANLAIGMATGILAARLLLPEGRGVLAAIMFWPGLFWSIGLLSFGDAVAYRISRADDRDQPAVTATSAWLALVLAAPIAGAAAALLPSLLGQDRVEFWLVAQLFALTIIPLRSLAFTALGIDQGRLLFKPYNSLRMLPPSLYLCGLLLVWGCGVVSLEAVLTASALGMCALAIVQVLRHRRELRARPVASEARHLLSLNFRFHNTNLAFLLGTHLDRLILMLFWDNMAIGLYVVALRWASAGLNTVTASFSSVIFPYLSAEASPDRQRALLARGLRYACLLLVVGTAGLILITPWLLPLLFGGEFADAVPVALVLLIAFLPLALRRIIIRSLRGFGEARPGTVAEVTGIVAFLASAWPLVLSFDLLGIGAALLIANLASLLYLVHYLSRRFGLSPVQWWGVNIRTVREVATLGLEQARDLRGRRVRAGSAGGSGPTHWG